LTASVREQSALVSGGVFLIAWTALLLWQVPQWQAKRVRTSQKGARPKDPFEIENEARATLGQIGNGLAVVAGLVFTWYQINDTRIGGERTLKITQQGQNTERFMQAVTQLGNQQATVDGRVGGIYSLERLAQDAAEDYYQPVMEVLAGYV